MVSFISLSKFLLFINIASAFIMPLPSTSNIDKLPVKVNRYCNNNNLIKMKLDKNVEKNINMIANIIITNSLYSYILSIYWNIYYTQAFIYSSIIYIGILFFYTITLGLISKFKK
jgi:hypothetical protein